MVVDRIMRLDNRGPDGDVERMVCEGWAFTVVAPSVSVKDRPLLAQLTKFERTDRMLVIWAQ